MFVLNTIFRVTIEIKIKIYLIYITFILLLFVITEYINRDSNYEIYKNNICIEENANDKPINHYMTYIIDKLFLLLNNIE